MTPRRVGGGGTGPRTARLAYLSDRLLEFPASLIERGDVRLCGPRRIASLLSLESHAITFCPFTFRRLPQPRRELLDRVLRFGLR